MRRGGASQGARSSGITHRRSAGRSRGPAPTGPSWRAAGESLKSPLIAGAASAPPPQGSDPHTSRRAVRPLPPSGSGRFSPHFSRAGDGKHEPTNRAAPRTLWTQWGLVGGTAVHQSELSRCGSPCPKRGSSRLVILSLFSPIKWLRGPLSRGPAPVPGKLWPLWGKQSDKRQVRTHPSFWRGRRGTTSGS